MKQLCLAIALTLFAASSFAQMASAHKSKANGEVPDLTAQDQNKKCEDGAIAACFTLGMMYKDGLNVTPDKDKAISLFKKTCESKQEIACLYLAELTNDAGISEASCTRGYGAACFVTDLIRGSSDHALTKKGCGLKYGPACTAIGGDLEATDRLAAMKYYESGCDLDDGAGCYRLGALLDAQGVHDKSKDAYTKACKLGFPAPTCQVAHVQPSGG